jgi:hypothetical protein
MSDYWKDFTVVETGKEDLGGNLRHGDTNSITPFFWRYLIERFAVRSLLDVGAGEGHALGIFHRMGVIAHGIDGLDRNVRNAKFPIALHDITMGPYLFPCDMTLCVEVVEHIEEAYVDNLVTTLANAPVVVMTHGHPGQPGHHHVNNQPREYWVEKLGQRGYGLSIDNDKFRDMARRENADCYFSESGLVFLNKG